MTWYFEATQNPSIDPEICHSNLNISISPKLDQYCGSFACLFPTPSYVFPPNNSPLNLSIMQSHHMPMNIYIFEMHIYFSGYDSVHFAPRYAAKNEPTGVDAHPCDDALPGDVW